MLPQVVGCVFSLVRSPLWYGKEIPTFQLNQGQDGLFIP